MKQLKKTKRPVVLTVKGKVAAVVTDRSGPRESSVRTSKASACYLVNLTARQHTYPSQRFTRPASQPASAPTHASLLPKSLAAP